MFLRLVERKSKRKPKPSEHLLNMDDIGESSDDSDFRIEDHDLNDSDFSGESSGSESVDEGNGLLCVCETSPVLNMPPVVMSYVHAPDSFE